MKKFVYPVILFEVGENNYTVLFPDLDIVASGETVEEAYLEAEEFLKTYLEFVQKMQTKVSDPSTFEETEKMNPKRNVLLADAEVDGNYELTNDEKQYKNFIAKYLIDDSEG